MACTRIRATWGCGGGCRTSAAKDGMGIPDAMAGDSSEPRSALSFSGLAWICCHSSCSSETSFQGGIRANRTALRPWSLLPRRLRRCQPHDNLLTASLSLLSA